MGRLQELARQRRRIEKNKRALAHRIAVWLRKRARLELENAPKQLKSGKLKLKKSAASDLDDELVELLAKFGLRQVDEAGEEMAIGYGGEWKISPKLIAEIIRMKKIKVKRLSRNIKERVLGEIRAIMREANSETPRPSVAEVSKRLREKFSPDAAEPLWALDSARAA